MATGVAVKKPKIEECGEILKPDNINENVVKAEYAVRGKLYQAAQERKKEGKNVILTNVGNPQALGQKPITFFRQVLALTNYSAMIDIPDVAKHFPEDAVARAKAYIENIPGGTGAYQDSRGNEFIRKEVAQFLTDRDGYPASTEDCYLTDGASQGIGYCLTLAIRGRQDGILTPIPQYPLYSAGIEMRNGTKCPYYIDESKDWGLSVEELQRATDEARKEGIQPRILVVINPGNPTGQCLSVENIKEIIAFCKKEKIGIVADEVYQTNIYSTEKKFVSFRKVAMDMGEEAEGVQLVSFHTVSKGFVGECGRRGGFFHLHNIHEGVVAQLYKLMSTNLSANVDGQIMTGMMVNPPKEGDASYPQYREEMNAILDSLNRRAKLIHKVFNDLKGITCNPVEGALYAYPNIQIPPDAVAAAKEKGWAPDVLYCMELLDETGICCIPGSGFGQAEGTYHFRTTILPSEETFQEIAKSFADFHNGFLKRYNAPEDM